MDKLIKELAGYCRNLESASSVAEKQRLQLETTEEWRELNATKSIVQEIKKDIESLRADIKEQTVKTFLESGVKHPHPAVGIRERTVIDYNITDAKVFCEERLPDALIVDKKTFEKFMMALEDRPEFVTVSKVASGTIATDLSEYVNAD